MTLDNAYARAREAAPGAITMTSSGPDGVSCRIFAMTAGGSILLGESERSDQDLAAAVDAAARVAREFGEKAE